MHLLSLLVALVLGGARLDAMVPPSPDGELVPGPWRAWLECPGGEMPFGLAVEADGDGGRVFLVNGAERIAIPKVEVEGDTILLAMPHYDSRIRAKITERGTRLDGEWEKRRGPDDWGRMPFHATSGASPRFGPRDETTEDAPLAGRWTVDFENDDLPAVAIFATTETPGELAGTFLTATGDYRYLAGRIEGDRLRLSVFDGAHAFLFDARVQDDGTLAGDFWSGRWYHETWTARRDETAALDDAFAQTTWLPGSSLADVVLPDLEGRPRSLVDAEFAGKAIVLQLFGSWCPNCHDETAYLSQLYDHYADRGLMVLGLAFELTGELARDAEQVRIFAEKYDVCYPMFLAGIADKVKASEAFPLVDRIRSFPTTIFLTGDGRVHSVHSGFVGPATGNAHAALRAQFESTIVELLATPPADDTATWDALTSHEWRSWIEFAGATYDFCLDDAGARTVTYTVHGSGVPTISKYVLPVRLSGDAVLIGEGDDLFDSEKGLPIRLSGETAPIGLCVYRFDREADVLLRPNGFGARLTRYHESERTFLAERGYVAPAGLVAALTDFDPRVRREAVWELTRQRAPRAASTLPEVLPLLNDPDLGVRRAAVWAFAECQDHAAVPALLEMRGHANAALRREVASALVRMSKKRGADLLDALVPLADDPDPIVRERALARLAEAKEDR